MPCFLKESLLFKICIIVIKKLIAWYNDSFIKKITSAVGSCFKQSQTARFLNRYIKRNPYFLNSKFFCFIRLIAALINRFLGFLNKVFTRFVKGSRVVNEAAAVSRLPFYEKISLLAVFVAAIEFGFCIGSFFIGTLAKVSFAYILFPVVICMLLLVWRRISFVFKNSFIYRCIKFLFD